jgi:uncharacterized protein
LLTADLVHARRRGGELRLVGLDDGRRARAGELATAYLAIAEAHVGCSRAEFEESCAAVEVEAHERRLADGLRKLVEDRCEFDAEQSIDPAAQRREVFLAAAAARRAGSFDREAIALESAARHGLSAEGLERALYADLRAAHRLGPIQPIDPARLVADYDLAQGQAVLLRAVRVRVDVVCATPGAYRGLFRKLKFLRLLHRIEPRAEGGYRIEIDGPFSLFESVTKYGLQLALALPALRECDAFRLEADVRWGPSRTPLLFRLHQGSVAPSRRTGLADGEGERGPDRLPDDVQALVTAVGACETPWRAAPASAILDLPGIGLCVPDLVFEHAGTGECVYLEVMGYWSREAVWRRVELVERGLDEKILFAVSERLRVSEEVLGDELPGGLYVYKRVMSARAVLERVDRLAGVRVVRTLP